MQEIMDFIIKYIGLLAFVVSFVNLFITLRSRWVRLRVSQAKVMPNISEEATFFLELLLENRSGLPISINQVSVVTGGETIPCETRHVFRVQRRAADQPARTVFLTSAFPVLLGSYESRRVSIQCPRHTKLARLLHQAPGGNPAVLDATLPAQPFRIDLSLQTSRGKRQASTTCEVENFQTWRQNLANTQGY